MIRSCPSAVDNMSPRHHFIRALQKIPVAPSITANSIIAVEGDGPIEQGNDGVVEYSSAHIEPVESELVVRWSHSLQGRPETIEEVRRILRLHIGLKTGGLGTSNAWGRPEAARPGQPPRRAASWPSSAASRSDTSA